MSIALYAVLVLSPEAATPTAANLIRACQAAYAQANRGSFSVQFKSKSSGQARNGRYTVDYDRPAALRFRAQYDQTEVAASDRTLTMVNGVIHGYDALANEVLSRTAGKTGSITQRFASIFPLDDPVRIVVDPESLAAFVKPLSSITDWKVKRVAGTWVATTKTSAKSTSFSITFDQRTHKLKRASAVAGSTTLDWIYTEAAFRPIFFRPPSGAVTVESFFEQPIPPKYANPATRTAVEASVRAYKRLTKIRYSVTDENGATQVSFAKDNIHQQSPAGSWSYVGGRLKAEPVGKAVIDRKASWRVVDMTVGQAGMPVEPMLRHFAKGENPLTSYLGSDLTAKLVGQIGFGNVMCDVIQLAGKGLRLTLTIRRDTHLLHAVESANVDPKGRVIARSERRFSY